MPSAQEKRVIRIAPNNPVFDLPVIVGIEEGLFEAAGLDVRFSATYADREKDQAERPVMSRLKEQMFERGSADSYNVCEWASIDRLERGARDGHIAALRGAVAAQGIAAHAEAQRRGDANGALHQLENQGGRACHCRLLLPRRRGDLRRSNRRAAR